MAASVADSTMVGKHCRHEKARHDLRRAGLKVPGPKFRLQVAALDIVAQRALDVALDLLGGALGLLDFAFGAQFGIIGGLADANFCLAGQIIANAFGLFSKFAHRKIPSLMLPAAICERANIECGPQHPGSIV